MFLLEQIERFAATGRVALICRDRQLTYRELDEQSDAFAAWLLETFGEDRTPVMIYGHKQMEFLPCMYGALKAGRAYVPVDITIPAERVGDIAASVEPRAFVDLEDARICEPEGAVRLTRADLAGIFAKYAGQKPGRDNWVSGNDDCYILFTSGSTGKPKGVPIGYSNIKNLADNFIHQCHTTEDESIVLNQISYSFDVSVVSVYLAVSLGKTLYTIDKYMVEDLKVLYEHLAASDVSLWVSTPSFAEICVVSDKFGREMMPRLERMLFCGETLTHKLVGTLWERFPGLEIVNTYGPTEATVLVTEVAVTKEMQDDQRPIPIGAPLKEVTFRIVDTEGRELPEGETGELQIISDSVSRGYYKRPDLTGQKFFETEVNGAPKRGYRTGDAVYMKDGQYYFCGRIDFQIKLNGFRIELEDIENNMVRVDNVSRAVVLPVYAEEKIDHLAAFVLLEHPTELSALKQSIAIKNALKEFLPAYMIPKKIVVKDSFPVNTNGKVDRKALLAELEGKK